MALAELLELAPAGVEEVELDDGRVEYAVYGAARRAAGAARPARARRRRAGRDLDDRDRRRLAGALARVPPAGADRARRAASMLPALRVRPPWEPAAAAGEDVPLAIELVIDPGQAFGTGAHATTRLCLELLLELRAVAPPPAPVLDVGTGSGVLAIAAAKLGYEPVLALDNEAESVARRGRERARSTASRSRRGASTCVASRCRGSGAGAGHQAGRGVIVLANLLAPLLLELCRRARPAALGADRRRAARRAARRDRRGLRGTPRVARACPAGRGGVGRAVAGVLVTRMAPANVQLIERLRDRPRRDYAPSGICVAASTFAR